MPLRVRRSLSLVQACPTWPAHSRRCKGTTAAADDDDDKLPPLRGSAQARFQEETSAGVPARVARRPGFGHGDGLRVMKRATAEASSRSSSRARWTSLRTITPCQPPSEAHPSPAFQPLEGNTGDRAHCVEAGAWWTSLADPPRHPSKTVSSLRRPRCSHSERSCPLRRKRRS